MNRKFFFIALFSIVLFGGNISDNAGSCSYTFLKNIQSARSEGMAIKGIALPAETPYTLDNNALIPYHGQGIGFSYRNLWGFGNAGSVWYSRNIGEDQGINGFIHYVNYGTIDRTDQEGNITGEFTPMDYAVGFGYGKRLSGNLKNLSLGVSAKIIGENADDMSSMGVAADMGLLYRFTKQRAQIGLSVKNAGIQLSALDEEKFPLPLMVGAGLSGRIPGLPFLGAIEADYFQDDGLIIGLGLELASIDKFKPRIGYSIVPKVESDLADAEGLHGLSAGFGLELKRFQIDYALKHYGVLGLSHNFAIELDI